MKKIVTIGGGTGQYNLLRGLKNYDVDLSAIVSIVDTGGSSGELRTSFGVLPPGDIRNCLLALTDDFRLKDLKGLFEYRFSEAKGTGLSNHSMGNLILTALNKKHGNLGDATKVAASILDIKGKVLPVSIENTNIYAKTQSGKILEKEEKISYGDFEERIKDLWLKPKAHIYGDAAKEIREADLIVICPGLLYTSIIPNFLVEGFKKAIEASNAKICYVCNLVSGKGTSGFNVEDFIQEIEKYLGKELDYVICNKKKPTQKIVDKYSKEESYFVEPGLEKSNKKTKKIVSNLLEEEFIGDLITARHNQNKIAKLIMDLL